MSISDEFEYLNAVCNILGSGDLKVGRNGSTKEIFGVTMKFNLRDGKLPLLTTKKINYKNVILELIWFLNGKTDNRYLQKDGVKIWDGNATREFLDSTNLQDYPEQILGPIYGKQWRDFNGPYEICRCSSIETCTCKGPLDNPDRFDQLEEIITCLKDPAKRNSRRLIMSAWNPCQLKQMALPPCHIMCQFNVSSTSELSCILTQRSGDMGLGVPYNIASYATLVHLLAHHCRLKTGYLIVNLGSAHIYSQHFTPLELQLNRTPTTFPDLSIVERREKIENYVESDFVVSGYNPQPFIKMEFVV